jgi:hypothetical protein
VSEASFASVFVKACRAKSATAADDARIGAGVPGEPLAVYGSGNQTFVFSDKGLSFKDPDGAVIDYSWDQLDFILPGDLSLANDKLHTSTDLSQLALLIGGIIGLVLAIGVLAYPVFSIFAGEYPAALPGYGQDEARAPSENTAQRH